ncbi:MULTISPECIES: hypothetical protein [Streptomyces]|uniref:hypothetical protein n=1 Tax=Streptomyces TaxID=1883 RepID=UPI0010403635|nr:MULTISPECIES: hypothetical protein [Streptomyces]MBT3077599.1 hypothetical protein [Streptomyces sp. COG21]MBT3084445.1 hypothetical protein [Streptomyces sp. COG20]MBT3085352.1 hypothetical protein [Streptomyces sp. CYG21]MBT3095928.1 hypothetical protein [Streptomyces sp. CBG30]MBT3100253.1 hypothetical protein [Streptomyces sp. CBG30]
MPTPELWTTEQAAEHLRILPKSASGLFSRRGIKRAGEARHPESGRIVALWSADDIRALAISRRPGARNDLTS